MRVHLTDGQNLSTVLYDSSDAAKRFNPAKLFWQGFFCVGFRIQDERVATKPVSAISYYLASPSVLEILYTMSLRASLVPGASRSAIALAVEATSG